MAYTFTDHTCDGVQVTFPFRFAGEDKGYIKPTDIQVLQQEDGAWVSASGWSFSGTNQITFTVPPKADTKLRIRRVVGKDVPYARFDRGVALDMKSLNNNFIHLLEATQELLDGFYPDGFFMKEDLNMGGFKVTNVGNGEDRYDAANYGQVQEVDLKHERWNQEQDLLLAGLKEAMTSNVAHRTIPWYYQVTQDGQKALEPPYEFQDALVFINGIMQFQIAGAFDIQNNIIHMSEPLRAGDMVYVLIGSRPSAPTTGESAEMHIEVAEGTERVDIGVDVSKITVTLDGLLQPRNSYTIEGTTLIFSEELPACTVGVFYYV